MANRLIAALSRLMQYLTTPPDPSDFVQSGDKCPVCREHVQPRPGICAEQCYCGELERGDRRIDGWGL